MLQSLKVALHILIGSMRPVLFNLQQVEAQFGSGLGLVVSTSSLSALRYPRNPRSRSMRRIIPSFLLRLIAFLYHAFFVSANGTVEAHLDNGNPFDAFGG
jgi:hypothetical protein